MEHQLHNAVYLLARQTVNTRPKYNDHTKPDHYFEDTSHLCRKGLEALGSTQQLDNHADCLLSKIVYHSNLEQV